MMIVVPLFWVMLWYDIEAAVRLVGPDPCEGRVEIFYGNAWGTICSALWDISDADVVCRELNCGKALEASTNGKYGQGAPYSGLTYFQCTGVEKEILACPFTNMPHVHAYQSDSGVKCSGLQRIWKMQLSIVSRLALDGLNNTQVEKSILSVMTTVLGKGIIDLKIRKIQKLK